MNSYLGFNCITKVEGLKNMPNLRVFHVQKQNLVPYEEILAFDPSTIEAISVSDRIRLSQGVML